MKDILQISGIRLRQVSGILTWKVSLESPLPFGYAYGSMELRTAFDGPVVKVIPLHYSNIWADISSDLTLPEGADTLYFTYRGAGMASFKGFTLRKG